MPENLNLAAIRAIVLDADGTLWRGSEPLPGLADILGGRQAGLKTILVTTGVDNEESILLRQITPDAIFGGLPDLLKAWQLLT